MLCLDAWGVEGGDEPHEDWAAKQHGGGFLYPCQAASPPAATDTLTVSTARDLTSVIRLYAPPSEQTPSIAQPVALMPYVSFGNR